MALLWRSFASERNALAFRVFLMPPITLHLRLAKASRSLLHPDVGVTHEPLAEVPVPALSGRDPFSFGGRGRPPSNQRNDLLYRPLHCRLEGETPGEPRE